MTIPTNRGLSSVNREEDQEDDDEDNGHAKSKSRDKDEEEDLIRPRRKKEAPPRCRHC